MRNSYTPQNRGKIPEKVGFQKEIISTGIERLLSKLSIIKRRKHEHWLRIPLITQTLHALEASHLRQNKIQKNA